MDIREFLEARLQEDELWALAASSDRGRKTTVAGGVHWTWAVGDNWEPVQADPLEPYMGGHDGQWSNPVVLRTVEEWPYGWGGPTNTGPVKVAEAEELRTADGAHIARHDPARVLRDVEAKRRILALHQLDVRRAAGTPFDPHTGEPQDVEWSVECVVCGWVTADRSSGCETLCLLALPFADHPDYDPSWALEATP